MEIFRVFDDRTSPCFCSQYPCKQLLTSVYWLHVTQLRPNRILDKNNNNQKNKRKKNATTITFSSIVENYKKMLDIFKLFWQICICHLNHLTEIRQHLKLFRKCPICKPKFWRTSYKWMRARCGREENHVNRNLTCFCCVPDDDDADRRWYDWVVCCFDVWWTALNMEQRQNFVGVLLLIYLSLSRTLLLIGSHKMPWVCLRAFIPNLWFKRSQFTNWKCKTLLRNRWAVNNRFAFIQAHKQPPRARNYRNRRNRYNKAN